MPPGAGVLQLADETVHVGIEQFGWLLEYLLVGQPSDRVELSLVIGGDGVGVGLEQVPERNVGVRTVSPRSGDGQEERTLADDRRRYGLDAQLLTAFTDHRGPRVLTRLDVSTGRQPQTRLAVRDEKQLTTRVIKDDEVAHQVHRRNIRLAHPIDRGSAGNPLCGSLQMGALQVVPRFDGTDKLKKAGTRLVVRDGEQVVG